MVRSDSSSFRFVVAGLGRIGHRHARWVESTPGLTLVGVCDPNETTREAFLQNREPGDTLPVLADYEQLLEVDADFVVIATPSHLHYDMTLKAVEADRHVLVEKPMAGSAREAEGMLAQARQHDRMLTVHQSHRYQIDTTQVQEEVASGVLGELVTLYRGHWVDKPREDWQIWRDYGGGALPNWGTHMIDALLLLLNEPPRSVYAQLGRTLNGGDAEDWFKIMMRTASGQVAEAELLPATLGKPIWHLAGTRGTLTVAGPPARPTLCLQPFGGDPRSRVIDVAAAGDKTRPYYADLAAHLSRGEAPPVRPEQVVQQMRVIDAARQSQERHESVEVAPVAEAEAPPASSEPGR